VTDNYIQEHFNSGQKIAYSERKIVLSDFCDKENLEYVDVLKTDTDGYDYQVLLGAERFIKAKPPIILQVEVGIGGSEDAHANLFAGVDVLLRRLGYLLLDLDAWRYSRSALPSPFAYDITAQTVTGPVGWFDVVYVDDPLSQGDKLAQWIGRTDGRDRLMKLIALYDLYGFPDCAAELMVALRDNPVSASWANWTEMLDLVVPPNPFGAQTYEAYIAAFRSDPKSFLPSAWNRTRLG
jgi:hypothetical protein